MFMSTCKLYLYQEKYRVSWQFLLFSWCWSECDVTYGLLQWRPLSVDRRRLIAWSRNRSRMYEICLPTWPSRWVLCISMQWLRLKCCHVACDEYASGEICSLQHMWVTGSAMWAFTSGGSLKFGVQGASTTSWFSLVNGTWDNGIRMYMCQWLGLLFIQVMTCHLCDANPLFEPMSANYHSKQAKLSN